MSAEEFKRIIKDYDEVSTAIKIHREKTKEMNGRKKQLETIIVRFMKHNKTGEVQTKKSRIIHRESKKTLGPKKSEFKSIYAEFFNTVDWNTFPRVPSIEKARMLEDYMKSKSRVTYSDALTLKTKNANK